MKAVFAVGLLTLLAPIAAKNIVQLAESVQDLSTLVAAVVAGDLADTLSSPGPFTVFAPTNEAFSALPAGVLASLMKPEQKKELVDILTYHVLPEKVLSRSLQRCQAVKTVEGKSLEVTRSGASVHVGSSLDPKDLKNVVKADNLASNGVVHVIDGVLLPPARPLQNIVALAASTPDLSTLVKALTAGKLTRALSDPGPFTVFAPTNEAFAKLPKATLDYLLDPKNIQDLERLLEYHVVPAAAVYKSALKRSQNVRTLLEGKDNFVEISKNAGGEVFVNRAKVTTADVGASNGVVHIIDTVLTIPKPNIVQLAERNPYLSILVSAVVAGDLADTLSSAGKFTVFAPTNEAFKALPAGTLDTLMKPENKAKLVDILKYHVLPEQVLSTQLKPFQAVTTVEGKLLHVQEWGGKVHVGPSLLSKDLKNVINADNVASNGVVHIIDGVLLPPSSVAKAIMV